MKTKVIRTVIFLIFTFVCFKLANFIFWDDVHSLSRLTLKEMYEEEENIDVVMLGSSYVVHGFDPEVANDILGKNTYNAGTKLQSLDGTYFFLKEISDYNDLETVYVDCNHVILSYFDVTNLERNLIISAYMKPSANRVAFSYETAGLEGIAKTNFPFLTKKNLNVPELLKIKFTDGYEDNNYDYVDFEYEAYIGDGFVGKKGALVATDNFAPIVDINPEKPITDFSYEYLEKICQLCDERDIRLVLVTLPVTGEMLSRVDNLQTYIDSVAQFAKEHNVEYHNFNLIKSKYCELTMKDYSDKEHLNTRGARKFTKHFCEVENKIRHGELSADDVFFDDLPTKITKDPDNTITIINSMPKEYSKKHAR